ncbi:MAG: hypothetical protein ACYDB7_01015 [Mycobacteriales bacterium]
MEESPVGLVGHVSVPIGADLPGEVMLAIRGGSEGYTAYSADHEPIPTGTRVVVTEHPTPRTVVVVPF